MSPNEQHIAKLRSRGIEIGEYCIINPSVEIGKGTKIMNYVELRKGTEIGEDCYIDSGVKMSGDCLIGDGVTIRYDAIIARGTCIGDKCYIAPQVMFNNLSSDQESIGGAFIWNNCFIGTNATIQHGIVLYPYTKIGAKSFMNKDVYETDTTWIGIPAKRIK